MIFTHKYMKRNQNVIARLWENEWDFFHLYTFLFFPKFFIVSIHYFSNLIKYLSDYSQNWVELEEESFLGVCQEIIPETK